MFVANLVIAFGLATWQGVTTADGLRDCWVGSRKRDKETEGVPFDDGRMNWMHSSWKRAALEEALGKLLRLIVRLGTLEAVFLKAE